MSQQDIDVDMAGNDHSIKDMSMDDVIKAIRQYKKAGRARKEALGGVSKSLVLLLCSLHTFLSYCSTAYSNDLQERLQELRDKQMHGKSLSEIALTLSLINLHIFDTEFAQLFMNAVPYMSVHTFRQLFHKRAVKFKQGSVTYPLAEEQKLQNAWLTLQAAAISASMSTNVTLASIGWPGPVASDELAGPSIDEMVASEEWLREQMGEESETEAIDAGVPSEKPQKGLIEFCFLFV
jgi:hypothetical protein